MLDTTTISLSEQSNAVVKEQLATGKYFNPNEVIEAGLILLREKQKMIELKEAIEEGIESGVSEDFSFEKHRKNMLRKYSQ